MNFSKFIRERINLWIKKLINLNFQNVIFFWKKRLIVDFNSNNEMPKISLHFLEIYSLLSIGWNLSDNIFVYLTFQKHTLSNAVQEIRFQKHMPSNSLFEKHDSKTIPLERCSGNTIPKAYLSNAMPNMRFYPVVANTRVANVYDASWDTIEWGDSAAVGMT